jgi:hypothetical protein
MCERSTYLRDQADKCRRHADAMGDERTQIELRKLADEYIAHAAALERENISRGPETKGDIILLRRPLT